MNRYPGFHRLGTVPSILPPNNWQVGHIGPQLPLIGKITPLERSTWAPTEALCAIGPRRAPVAGSLPVTFTEPTPLRAPSTSNAGRHHLGRTLPVRVSRTSASYPTRTFLPAGRRRPQDLDCGDHAGAKLFVEGLEQAMAQQTHLGGPGCGITPHDDSSVIEALRHAMGADLRAHQFGPSGHDRAHCHRRCPPPIPDHASKDSSYALWVPTIVVGWPVRGATPLFSDLGASFACTPRPGRIYPDLATGNGGLSHPIQHGPGGVELIGTLVGVGWAADHSDTVPGPTVRILPLSSLGTSSTTAAVTMICSASATTAASFRRRETSSSANTSSRMRIGFAPGRESS